MTWKNIDQVSVGTITLLPGQFVEFVATTNSGPGEDGNTRIIMKADGNLWTQILVLGVWEDRETIAG